MLFCFLFPVCLLSLSPLYPLRPSLSAPSDQEKKKQKAVGQVNKQKTLVKAFTQGLQLANKKQKKAV
jgi:hypothetical protein